MQNLRGDDRRPADPVPWAAAEPYLGYSRSKAILSAGQLGTRRCCRRQSRPVEFFMASSRRIESPAQWGSGRRRVLTSRASRRRTFAGNSAIDLEAPPWDCRSRRPKMEESMTRTKLLPSLLLASLAFASGGCQKDVQEVRRTDADKYSVDGGVLQQLTQKLQVESGGAYSADGGRYSVEGGHYDAGTFRQGAPSAPGLAPEGLGTPYRTK